MSREASSVSPKRRNRLFDNKPKLEFKPCKGVIRHKDWRDKLPNQTEIEVSQTNVISKWLRIDIINCIENANKTKV